MADADRDSDLGDDSPVSARSEGESSGEQSCESSDEGVGRDVPATHQPHPQPMQTLQSHQTMQSLPVLQTLPQSLRHQQISSMHHPVVSHQQMNSHSLTHSHQRNSPRPLERELKVRDDFESLKSSLHPHLSSLASLAQGAPLSAPSNVFALAGAGAAGFPYAPPSFLTPAPPPPAQPAGSASSSSSEGSAAGWSFEEQYKQVRQLYEISDDPQRKEFLDDLFSFMQKRGSPINRLPIMAKSVLDLYELYNLVIARGGLVEVINKKLWQEIIKGLRLPSSITSAAFTLRTQYMKYLYDYECEKKNLSTRAELDAAIEGNKREGRRASGQYDAQAALAMMPPFQPPMNRGVPVSLAQFQHHMQPLSLSLGGVAPRLPHLPPHAPQLMTGELEMRLRECVRIMHQRDMMANGSDSPPPRVSPILTARDIAALNTIEVTRLAAWNTICQNSSSDTEQREALNLSDSPTGVKREASSMSPPPPPKRRTQGTPSPRRTRSPGQPSGSNDHRSPPPANVQNGQNEQNVPNGVNANGVNGASFKVTTEGDAATGDQRLVVTIEINGVTYEGVLLPSNIPNLPHNGHNGHDGHDGQNGSNSIS